MITTNDVLQMHPEAAEYPSTDIDKWVSVANAAITPARVNDLRTLSLVQAAFVMHHLERPPLDITAPWVIARMAGRSQASANAPHPWAGTPYGDSVIAATRY